MNIDFPECVAADEQGSPLRDSQDHRSHVAYVERDEPCPPEFPYRMPRINLEVRYELDKMVEVLGKDVVQDPSNWYLSTGDHTGAGAHADFLSGWNEAVLLEAIRECRGGNAESGCILTEFFGNSRADDRAKRVDLLKEMPNEVISPLDELLLFPDGSCPQPNHPSVYPTTYPTAGSLSPTAGSLSPTKAPTQASNSSAPSAPATNNDGVRSCNTSKERECRAKCFKRRECGDNKSSSCHALCRHKCCDNRSDVDERSCNTPDEKECRAKCIHNKNCGDNEYCKMVCRASCCS